MITSAIPRFKVLVAEGLASEISPTSEEVIVNHTLVGTLFDLLVCSGLLHEVENLVVITASIYFKTRKEAGKKIHTAFVKVSSASGHAFLSPFSSSSMSAIDVMSWRPHEC
jgi:hypothetical protein